MNRLLVVGIGLLILCSCEYAKPTQNSTAGKQSDTLNKDSNTSAPDRKPAYVLAEPADTTDLTGINGGQRFVFDPPDYGGEWTQDNDSDLVRFFVVDHSGSKNIAVAADNFCVKAGDGLLFSLDPDNEDSSGSYSFSLDDRNLALAMNSTVEVMMSVQGKSYRATLNDDGQSDAEPQTKVDD